MKKDEIIRLLDAGYSKTEIDAMEVVEAAEASSELSLSEGPGNSDGARPEPAQEPTETEDPNKEIKSWLKSIKDDIDAKIEEIKALQQQQNVKTFNVGDDPRAQKTTRDIMNEIYNPQVFKVEEE